MFRNVIKSSEEVPIFLLRSTQTYLEKVQKKLKSLRKNSEALIIADDPMAEVDLKHFCLNNNYSLEEVKNKQGDEEKFFSIKKG